MLVREGNDIQKLRVVRRDMSPGHECELDAPVRNVVCQTGSAVSCTYDAGEGRALIVRRHMQCCGR